MEKYIEKAINLVMEYGPKILLAIVILIVGLWIIKRVVKLLAKILKKRNIDPSLHSFVKSLVGVLLKVMLIISVMTMIGVNMTSFIAILGAAGLAIGLALSGTLQNFAGGVMILLFRPYKVGDFIQIQGYSGTVKDIQIFHTVIITLEFHTVIIPNSPISTDTIVNYTTNPHRRVDITFGISYKDDIDKARGVIMEVVKENKLILEEPEKPFVKIVSLGDSSVNFTVRVWALNEHYWDVFFYLNEYVKKAFDKNGVSIPFPQTDVHVHNATEK